MLRGFFCLKWLRKALQGGNPKEAPPLERVCMRGAFFGSLPEEPGGLEKGRQEAHLHCLYGNPPPPSVPVIDCSRTGTEYWNRS